jgi:hypothetical protein
MMTLTPDQVRLRLQQIAGHETDVASADIVALLADVLPELIALAQGRSALHAAADAGRRYAGGVPGRMYTEREAR